MCGIAGMFVPDREIDRDRFEKMVDLIAYRGPDDRGTFYDNGLALGHRRLAIIDTTHDGHQPFCYQDKYVLVYNGEVYNYRELREELEKKGFEFRTQTDTEVVICAYDFWGTDCVNHFNGMWSFALYDIRKNILFCSRDRFGVKPFYYKYDSNGFVFGSEIKQILAMNDGRPKANRDKLLRFIVGGDVDYSHETMFDGICQLLGGYNLILDLSEFKCNLIRYYNLGEHITPRRSYEESISDFRNFFINSVKLRLRADVPVGYCLSGGLDSSAIVCTASKIMRENKNYVLQHSITSCFEDKSYDESEYAEAVVSSTNVISHKVFPDAGCLFEQLNDIIWHMDEPFGSTSIFAQWCVFEEAQRQGLTVMLDGQGADEQLAGYSGFYSVIFAYYLRKFNFKAFFKEYMLYKKLRASTEKYLNFQVILIKALINAYFPKHIIRFAKKKFLLASKSPFDKATIKWYSSKMDMDDVADPENFILDNFQHELTTLLHMEDRDSMAHSIETRVPFLDYELTELVYNMPITYKVRDGKTKAIMRDALSGIIPDKIRDRYSKFGFITPEDQWIRENTEVFRQELSQSCDILYPLINKERVLDWFDSGNGLQRGDNTAWHIICAGRWMKVFNVQI